ncbi:MAG: peptidoglycan-associated lipoprotein Pal [Alphaproteobacteria bacterium]|nr:peptidoglycan-associated lipoprotein Pal [Alphaproteobacteria bacterium]
MNTRFLCAVLVSFALAACASKKDDMKGSGSGGAGGGGAAASTSGPDPKSIPYFNQVVGNSVGFDYDKYDLRSDSQAVLRGQAAWLNQNPNYTVTIEGHCDERGTREYNLGLGERRANAVKQYLQAQGVAAARIKTVSYGKERPVCVASNEDCYGKNRRGVSVVQ